MSGWIKLHRKITEHWIWEDPEKLKWWLDLIMMANHEPRDILINNEIMKIDVGMRHTSEQKLADRWNISRSTVSRFLKLLEKEEMINVTKSRQKGTSYKVLKYSDYQAKNESKEHQTNNARTSNEHQTNNARTSNEHKQELKELERINKNEKNEKNEKNDEEVIVNPISFYERNGFGTIAPMLVEEVGHWVNEFEQAGNSKEDANQLIIKAMEISVKNNVRNWNYVNKILNNWKQRGLTTLEKIEAAEQERKAKFEAKQNKLVRYSKPSVRKESLPEWAESNTKVKDKPLSAQEQAEFQERLKKIREQRNKGESK